MTTPKHEFGDEVRLAALATCDQTAAGQALLAAVTDLLAMARDAQRRNQRVSNEASEDFRYHDGATRALERVLALQPMALAKLKTPTANRG